MAEYKIQLAKFIDLPVRFIQLNPLVGGISGAVADQATSFIATGIVEISAVTVAAVDQFPVISLVRREKELLELSARVKAVEVAVVVEIVPLLVNS